MRDVEDALLRAAEEEAGQLPASATRQIAGRVPGVLRNRYFLIGVACMAVSFYSLLFGLSWNDVSLIGPAAASLTFVANAIAAKIFLHEHVDSRRWAAALFVAAGVVLMGL